MGRITNWFRQMFSWIMGSAEDVIPESAKLDSEAGKLLSSLEKQKDATTSHMALVSEAREKLEEEVAENEALKGQAKRFRSDANEDMLYRVMEMKLKSDDRIKELSKTYESLRASSRQAITSYKAREKEVMEKIDKLELLKEQSRINKIRGDVQRIQQQIDFSGSSQGFDRLAEKVRRKSAQLDASGLLSDGEDKAAEMEIKEAMKNQRLVDAVRQLESEMERETLKSEDTVEGEYLEMENETVKSARQLLSEPAFGEITPQPAEKKDKEPAE
jgi:phage shock protein A